MKNTIAVGEPQAITTIGDIQRSLAKRFGIDVETGTGRATLSLARDRAELTDRKGEIVATGLDGVIAFIGAPPSGNVTVALDPLSEKLVRWYAEENERDIDDVVNGVIAGELGHLRGEIESQMTDDSPEHVREYVLDAIQRRKVLSKAA